jgi:hypothetical protein
MATDWMYAPQLKIVYPQCRFGHARQRECHLFMAGEADRGFASLFFTTYRDKNTSAERFWPF